MILAAMEGRLLDVHLRDFGNRIGRIVACCPVRAIFPGPPSFALWPAPDTMDR